MPAGGLAFDGRCYSRSNKRGEGRVLENLAVALIDENAHATRSVGGTPVTFVQGDRLRHSTTSGSNCRADGRLVRIRAELIER